VPRGRRRIPDAIKELKGNPGKRKLALDGAVAPVQKQVAARTMPSVAIPEFLKHERERTIFKRVIEDYLQRRIAREVDFMAYGRWASYVHDWMSCKEYLEGKAKFYKPKSANGNERLASHPVWQDQIALEKLLQSLEDRLGLNPAARQSILRGLAAMPSAIGGLFGDEPHAEDPTGPPAPSAPAPEGPPPEGEVMSPLGFLRLAGKPH
jgi:Phage terminase, small subunit